MTLGVSGEMWRRWRLKSTQNKLILNIISSSWVMRTKKNKTRPRRHTCNTWDDLSKQRQNCGCSVAAGNLFLKRQGWHIVFGGYWRKCALEGILGSGEIHGRSLSSSLQGGFEKRLWTEDRSSKWNIPGEHAIDDLTQNGWMLLDLTWRGNTRALTYVESNWRQTKADLTEVLKGETETGPGEENMKLFWWTDWSREFLKKGYIEVCSHDKNRWEQSRDDTSSLTSLKSIWLRSRNCLRLRQRDTLKLRHRERFMSRLHWETGVDMKHGEFTLRLQRALGYDNILYLND